jgi:hypothetical protein
MAQLTDADYSQIKKIIKSNPTAHQILKDWGLDKTTWKALFQETEDWNVDGFTVTPTTSFKAALDAITATTNQQAKMIWSVWAEWQPKVI